MRCQSWSEVKHLQQIVEEHSSCPPDTGADFLWVSQRMVAKCQLFFFFFSFCCSEHALERLQLQRMVQTAVFWDLIRISLFLLFFYQTKKKTGSLFQMLNQFWSFQRDCFCFCCVFIFIYMNLFCWRSNRKPRAETSHRICRIWWRKYKKKSCLQFITVIFAVGLQIQRLLFCFFCRHPSLCTYIYIYINCINTKWRCLQYLTTVTIFLDLLFKKAACV